VPDRQPDLRLEKRIAVLATVEMERLNFPQVNASSSEVIGCLGTQAKSGAKTSRSALIVY
jgi:hypothetical protein